MHHTSHLQFVISSILNLRILKTMSFCFRFTGGKGNNSPIPVDDSELSKLEEPLNSKSHEKPINIFFKIRRSIIIYRWWKGLISI